MAIFNLDLPKQVTGLSLDSPEQLAGELAITVANALRTAIEARGADDREYPALLRRLVDPARFPALAAAVDAGVFDQSDGGPLTEFHSGLDRLLDGIAAQTH